ncbi:protein RIC-3 [Pangasianodon hypophthalmus]|uniref:protein RIC-3 n=1 Tax=Pangasianodon hypophthalmus TaxID=310915 RepID=UPI00230757FC|nr:protein RIC-3 [Pangasianodon hypophthalmus]
MLVSGIQRITLLSCLVLSMALFLPKLFLSAGEEKLLLHSEAVGPGSPVRYGHGASSGEDDQWTPESLYTTRQNPETFSHTKTLRKSTLLAQVTPIYGFGIFLYIIYIFYKSSQRNGFRAREEGSVKVFEERCTCEYCVSQEVALIFMYRPGYRCRKDRSGREERKLQDLTKITHMLVEGRPLEDVTPEVEAEETPYSADWEGYAEETFPQYEVPLCRRRYPSVILEEPYGDVPTPEELAERMEREDEEDEKNEEETEEVKDECSEDEGIKGDGDLKQALLEKGEETDDNEGDADEEDYKQDEEEEEEVGEPCLAHNSTDEEETPGNQKEGETSSRRKQITFSNHRHVFHYPKGGAVGCSYEDEEVEEDAPEDDDDDADDDVVEDKQDEDDDLKEMEMEREEDDPLMEAERLGFSTQFTCDPEEQEVDLIDFLLTYKPEAVINSDQSGAAEAPGLRMRYKNQKKEN